MFTSKEVLERTGISRATLNNYISSGLLPRPDVLPPEPNAGSAPRIGYFPDDTVDRILEIQRLKADGWSMGRIARQLSEGKAPEADGQGQGSKPAHPAETAAAPAAAAVPATAPPQAPSPVFEQIDHPAYGVGAAFELLWSNAAASSGATGRLLALPPDRRTGRGILDLLLQGGRDPATDDLVGFHLAVARQRGVSLEALARGLAPAQATSIGQRLLGVGTPRPGSIPTAVLAAPGANSGLAVHAVHLRAGVVFLFTPAADEQLRAPVHATAGRPLSSLPEMARLAPVAALAIRLQDADAWWRRLPAPEFQALMADLRTTVDAVVAQHGGGIVLARPAGVDVLIVDDGQRGHLADAVLVAQALREAGRSLSRRWQLRKGWQAELHLNTGLADGHEWLAESQLPGEAVQAAATLALSGRDASVWATRTLIDRLPAALRDGLHLAAPVAGPMWTPVAGCFARLQDLVTANGGPPADVAPRYADLAVAVLLPAATDRSTPATTPPSQDV